MIKLKVLKVFVNEEGVFGNQVAILSDCDHKYDKVARQKIAARTGFSETVFIDDIGSKTIQIFTPQQEIPFAGHAVVGVVSYLEKEIGQPVNNVIGSAGAIIAWSESGLTWVKAELRSTPPWWHERLDSVEALEALTGPQCDAQTYVQLWAWIDEKAGIIRSRTFAPGWGIPEDEANGSGCMRLAAALGRRLLIRHGKGSVIHARPSTPGFAEVGGTTVFIDDLIVNAD